MITAPAPYTSSFHHQLTNPSQKPQTKLFATKNPQLPKAQPQIRPHHIHISSNHAQFR
jgi:hypothetical protein